MNKRAVGAEYEAVAASYLMKQGMVCFIKISNAGRVRWI